MFRKRHSFYITLLFLICIGLNSCIGDEDFHQDFHYVSMPIYDVTISDTIVVDEESIIIAHSKIQENCQAYLTMDHESFKKQILIKAKAIEHEDKECGEYIDFSLKITFTPDKTGTYTFLFWSGQNPDTKIDKFITKEIFVKYKDTQTIE